MIKLFLALSISLFSTIALAFSINDGEYSSDDGCTVNVETFVGHNEIEDGSKAIHIEYYKAKIDKSNGQILDEEYYSDTKIIDPSYEQILSSVTLCGDEEMKMPNAVLVQKTKNTLEFQCGGTFDAIDENIKILTSGNDLKELIITNKVATFSVSESIYSPLPKSTKAKIKCSNFIKN